MKIQLLITISILLNIYTASGQMKTACDRLLEKEITLEGIKQAPQKFKSDFKKLMACEFDSIDYQIFTGPKGTISAVFPILLSSLKNPSNEKQFTFSDLRDILLKLKKEKGYAKTREIVEAKNKMSSRNGTLTHWKEDKNILSQMGLGKDEINDIHQILKANVGRPYTDILKIYADTLQQRSKRQEMRRRQK